MSGVFSAPIDHGRGSVQVGFDELGRPVYRTPLGHLVGQEQPSTAAPQNALATMLRTEVDPITGRAIHYQDEVRPSPTVNALAALGQSIAQGLTAPARAARGEPVTLGDVWSTALDAGAMAAPMPAPRGAVRSGAMRTEGAADEIESALRHRYPDVSLSIRRAPGGGITLSRIVIPQGQRGRGYGTQVMSDLVRMADDMGVQISLTPSSDFGGNVSRLRDFYGRFGFVRNRGRGRDFSITEDMYRVAAPTQSPADEIARMLREGRASEITDEMMAALTPEDNARLFRLYEEGATGQPMPMDEASRMARAREMGFDERAYHGTGYGGFDAFSSDRSRIAEATYSDVNPAVAGVYARYGDSSQVYPVSIRALNPERFDLLTWDPLRESGVINRSRSEGYDAFFANDGRRIVFDPRNIRSRFARFDPRLSHLAHLSAGGAGAALMLEPEQIDRNALLEFLERPRQ